MTIETKKALDKAAELIDLAGAMGAETSKVVIFIEAGKPTGVSIDGYASLRVKRVVPEKTREVYYSETANGVKRRLN